MGQAKSKKRDPKKDSPEMREVYNRMRNMSFVEWRREMNIIHSRAYMLCFKHFQQAASATLTPKFINLLFAKVKEVRELWDGLLTSKTGMDRTTHTPWEDDSPPVVDKPVNKVDKLEGLNTTVNITLGNEKK